MTVKRKSSLVLKYFRESVVAENRYTLSGELRLGVAKLNGLFLSSSKFGRSSVR